MVLVEVERPDASPDGVEPGGGFDENDFQISFLWCWWPLRAVSLASTQPSICPGGSVVRRSRLCLVPFSGVRRRCAVGVWWGWCGRRLLERAAGGGRGGELLGQHRRSAGRQQGGGAEHHRQPRTPTRTPTSRRRRTAIAIARSQMAIVNGIGYDAWASKLLAANPSSSRAVLDVGKLLGLEGRR